MDGEISADELGTLLEADNPPTVVDIRNRPAFRRKHIPGSLNIPFNALPGEVGQLRDEDRVVTVCPHGEASVRAGQLIASFEGFDGRVESLAGGLAAWDGPLTRAELDSNESPDAPF